MKIHDEAVNPVHNVVAEEQQTGITPPNEVVQINPYYNDTISSATTPSPLVSEKGSPEKTTRLEAEIQVLSKGIDEELQLANLNFKKLQELVFKIIQAIGRKLAKDDQEYIFDMNNHIQLTALKIQNTYNNWKGVTITVISATISIVGGVGGLAPLLPITMIGEEASKTLATASQGLGNAGTSLGGIANIFNSASEGERGVLQIHLKRKQDKEEDKKSAKHGHKEITKDAAKTAESADQAYHQTFTEMAR